ncbi:C40 family peptidase [Ureibacillus chungkukjangi]|uniref:S-layer family protein n=1 Tax=Ureibacillus chungkukjangi TaxID=1202712 RepID=A0A318TRW2_9BACL|nr:C40 family peptidase [Ureibacillus chungkukjangi]PYF07586.1 S-layer family protein [Ureibacillus chungkukjangi]
MKKKWLLPIFASFMVLSAFPADNVDAASPADVLSTAKKYINTPYRSGGTTASGFDCSGFTSKVFSELGITLNRTSGGQYNQGTAVSKANLQVGDLVFFNTSGKGVSHVAIYIGNSQMIGAESSEGVTISSINDPYYWGKRYVGAKRVANFEEEKVVEAVNKTAEVKNKEINFNIYASRAEVAVKIAEALGLDTTDTNTGFEDVKSTHANAGAIAAVRKAGIFSGDNGKFNPASPITRSQISLVIMNAFKLEQGNISKTFTDVKPGSKTADAIQIMASNGITSGKADGTYGLADYVTKTHLDIFVTKAKAIR